MNLTRNETASKNSVLVFVEHRDGKIADVSLELICKARELSDTLKVAVTAVVVGYSASMQDLQALGQYGCDTVYLVVGPRLGYYTTIPYAKAVVSVIQKYQPQIVLFGASINGRDLAPRVASALRCGLTADCTDLQIGDYEFMGKKWQNTLLQIRPAFGGNIVATIVSPESVPSMASVREGVMKLNAPDVVRQAQVITETLNWQSNDFPSDVLKVVHEAKGVNLKAANIIIAAGMGVATQGSLQLVQELA